LRMGDDAGSVSQRAAAMAAFSQRAAKVEEEREFTPSSQLSAREKAMQNLNKKGVVSAREARGATGSSQHGQAMANLAGHLQDEGGPKKVVPNWKLTAAQKNAAAARAEIKGSTNHAEAAAKFGLEKKGTVGQLPISFVPVAKTHNSAPNMLKSPRSSLVAAPPPSAPTAVPTPRLSAGGPTPRLSVGNATAEAAEGVEKDLSLLIAAFPRLGTKKPDGSIETTFAKVVDDEALEQQLESLVGTLKAGRKRGVLLWEGQMLLKGAHDNVSITYVGEVKAAAKPERKPEPKPEPKIEPEPEPEPEAKEEAKPEEEPKGKEAAEAKEEAVEETAEEPAEKAEEEAKPDDEGKPVDIA